jgi:hypothetical protein
MNCQAYGDNLLDNRYRLIFIDSTFLGTSAFNRPRSFGVRVDADY